MDALKISEDLRKKDVYGQQTGKGHKTISKKLRKTLFSQNIAAYLKSAKQ